MSLAENSFPDECQSPTKMPSHSLCSQLANQQFKWSNSLRGSEQSIGQSQGESDYIEPNSNNRLENQPELNLHSNHSLEVEPFEGEQEGEEEESGPKTITLIGDSILSKESMNVSSRISQYSSEVDNQSYAAFLSMLETSYAPMVKGFQVLFQNVCNLFTQRSMEIEKTYLQFLRIKYAQQKSSIQMGLGKTVNNKNHMIYIDCKGLADQIRRKIEGERAKQKQYAENIGDIYNKARRQFETIKNIMKQKQAKIRNFMKKLTATAQEMTDIMIPRNRKLKKSTIKEELLATNYVRTKYMIAKEKEYLLFMAQFMSQVTSYVSSTCFEVQPKNCLLVKQALCLFIEASSGSNPMIKEILKQKFENLEHSKCHQMVYTEISNLLEICIPSNLEIRVIKNSKGQDKLHQMIEALIRESQSVVYIPVIEMEGKDYAYHSKNKAKVFWRRVDYTKKLKQNQIEQFQAHVVITHEGYLILELLSDSTNEQKMAILKLTNIKLSSKLNQVIITDKGTGVLGYLLSSNSVLGALVFESLDSENRDQNESQENFLITEFVDRVKEVMEVRKERLKK